MSNNSKTAAAIDSKKVEICDPECRVGQVPPQPTIPPMPPCKPPKE